MLLQVAAPPAARGPTMQPVQAVAQRAAWKGLPKAHPRTAPAVRQVPRSWGHPTTKELRGRSTQAPVESLPAGLRQGFPNRSLRDRQEKRQAGRHPTREQEEPSRRRRMPEAAPIRLGEIPRWVRARLEPAAVPRPAGAAEALQQLVATAALRAEARPTWARAEPGSHPSLALRAVVQEAAEPMRAAAAGRPRSALQAAWALAEPPRPGLQVRLDSPTGERPRSRPREGSMPEPGRLEAGAGARPAQERPRRESPRSPGLTSPATKPADPSSAMPQVGPPQSERQGLARARPPAAPRWWRYRAEAATDLKPTWSSALPGGRGALPSYAWCGGAS